MTMKKIVEGKNITHIQPTLKEELETIQEREGLFNKIKFGGYVSGNGRMVYWWSGDNYCIILSVYH